MQINVEIPPDLDAVYSNLAIITHSASEVIIDFARILPNSPRARVYARVVTTPMHAKLLLRALSENLEQYEARFGEIKTFDSGDALAQQFFSAIRPPNQPDSG
jgi:hypothetical protein